MIGSIALTFALCGCAPEPAEPPADLSPEEAEKVTRVMVAWLECEECLAGELDQVVEHAQYLQPMLISVLRDGPSPASRELLRLELEKRYDRISEYQRTHDNVRLASSREDFVARYLDNFTAQYQSRAAIALAAVGGESARRALQEAQQKAERDDVRAQISESLATLQ